MVDSPFLDLLLFAVLSAARQDVLAANSTEYLLRKTPWFSVCLARPDAWNQLSSGVGPRG